MKSNEKDHLDWNIGGYPVIALDKAIYGFIYEIEYEDGDKYIGAKKAVSELEMNCLRNGEPREHHIEFVNRRKGGKIVTREKIRKPSNWQKYIGSYKQKDDETMKIKSKTILDFCFNRKDLTVSEVKFILQTNALYLPNYRNSQVLGKIFSHEICTSGDYTPDTVVDYKNDNGAYENLVAKCFNAKKYKKNTGV